ncbi:phospholipase effector Tle1 domain-containing protein [Halopseudomonas sp.]|uniref:phospholipase effector Tle1 domain-containing protein n=1 Tax=Halopseudomonas sp. TaxID=2901191 RepID=UPI003562B68C
MTTRDVLTQAQAISALCRVPARVTPICGRTLHIGFFFDGFARNLEEDLRENRLSNIGRLFLAHMDTDKDSEFHCYRSAYLSGLGADYDDALGVQASGALNRAQSDTMDIPADVVAEEAIEVAKDQLSGRDWWQRLKRDLGKLRDKPQNSLKVFRDMLINTAAEVVEPIRDSRWAAHLVKSGVDVRLEGARTRLNREINALNDAGQIPLRTIKVSVFGFDFGATLARAFIHELMELSQQRGSQYYYRHARLEIVFAGLFDAVDRSVVEIPPLEFILPTTTRVDDGGLVHPQVKAVLHLVAAHERRFYRRARLLGERRRDWREELMPGVSEDIGGGIAPGEQKPSNELALVSLHRMYRAAFAAGVSLVARDELPAKGRMIASLFTFNDKSPSQRSALSLVRHYQRWVGNPMPNSDAFLIHMRCYMRWLAHLWRAYKVEMGELAAQSDAAHRSQYRSNNGVGSGIFGLTTETAAERRMRLSKLDEIQQRQRHLRADLSWLEDVDSEATSIKNRLRVIGPQSAGTPQNLKVWEALLYEWDSPQPLIPEVVELFAFFVHDQQVLSTAQRSARSMSGENFFAIRGIDQPTGTLSVQNEG